MSSKILAVSLCCALLTVAECEPCVKPYIGIFFQNVDKRLENMETKMNVMGDQIRTLSKAFFDYDLEANQELLAVESELMRYFPLSELGEKTDFLLSDPVCAKVITKHVKQSLYDDKSNVSELTEVVRKAAMKCFALELRAHMNLVKRKVKQYVYSSDL